MRAKLPIIVVIVSLFAIISLSLWHDSYAVEYRQGYIDKRTYIVKEFGFGEKRECEAVAEMNEWIGQQNPKLYKIMTVYSAYNSSAFLHKSWYVVYTTE